LPQAQAQQQAAPVGTYFGLPGFTQPFEQYENLNGIITPIALAAQTPWNPPGSLQKTDIVKWWEMETVINWTTTVTGSAISPMAPYNIFQGFKLKLQGQYTPIEVESGSDAAFFQMYRPMRGEGQAGTQTLLGATAVGSNAGAFANATMPQVNQTTTGIVANPASASNWSFVLEVPGGLFIDSYWDQAIDGTLLPNAQGRIAPMSAFVSPQYMGGGERVVVPTFNYGAITAANADQGPLTGSAAGAASVTQNLRRVGYYGSANPAELPPVFNWQYRRASKRFPVGQFTKVDIPVTEYGQLLSLWVKIFDPTAGTFYNVAQITKCQLLYGSNLPRFDDDVLTMQRRFNDQHGFLPPVGHVAWDMLANTSGANGLSNDFKVLNTLTNANTHVHLEVSSAPVNASAYAVIGTELLVPVATQ
jgi:hypothetical protein